MVTVEEQTLLGHWPTRQTVYPQVMRRHTAQDHGLDMCTTVLWRVHLQHTKDLLPKVKTLTEIVQRDLLPEQRRIYVRQTPIFLRFVTK